MFWHPYSSRKNIKLELVGLCHEREWLNHENNHSRIESEPGHEKMCLMSYANNKGADQTAHPLSLISAFIVRCLDSIISLDSIAEISRL